MEDRKGMSELDTVPALNGNIPISVGGFTIGLFHHGVTHLRLGCQQH